MQGVDPGVGKGGGGPPPIISKGGESITSPPPPPPQFFITFVILIYEICKFSNQGSQVENIRPLTLK